MQKLLLHTRTDKPGQATIGQRTSTLPVVTTVAITRFIVARGGSHLGKKVSTSVPITKCVITEQTLEYDLKTPENSWNKIENH